ncbi:hypothetical protein BJX64DRAFT_58717 [Aspergillus heterothallicus]
MGYAKRCQDSCNSVGSSQKVSKPYPVRTYQVLGEPAQCTSQPWIGPCPSSLTSVRGSTCSTRTSFSCPDRPVRGYMLPGANMESCRAYLSELTSHSHRQSGNSVNPLAEPGLAGLEPCMSFFSKHEANKDLRPPITYAAQLFARYVLAGTYSLLQLRR